MILVVAFYAENMKTADICMHPGNATVSARGFYADIFLLPIPMILMSVVEEREWESVGGGGRIGEREGERKKAKERERERFSQGYIFVTNTNDSDVSCSIGRMQLIYVTQNYDGKEWVGEGREECVEEEERE